MVAQSSRKSIKHDIINKANSSMLIAVAIAIFVVVFCLFAAKALISQSMYQNRVISESKKTLKTLQESRKEAEDLQKSYTAFAGESVNMLGGSSTGTGPRDGDNAKLVLDALPYELDFPGLSSSIEKILLDGGYTIQAIGGEDTGSVTGENVEDTSTAGSQSEVQEIEYPFTINASPEASLSLLQTLERSIRPFKLTSLLIEGSGNSLDISINMKTYYKPSVGLQVSTKVVK